MRKIFYFFLWIALATPMFAQISDLIPFELKSNPITLQVSDLQNSQILDFNNITPLLTQKGDGKIIAKTDTLNQFIKSSTGFTSYAVTISGNTYPLTGWNPYYYFLGQKFNINGSAKVSEILFAASSKFFIGAINDSIRGYVFTGEDSQGLPTSILGNSYIMFDKIDTNSSVVKYSSIKFSTPVQVSSKFVTMLLTFNNTNEYDAVVLYSNMQGDGKGQKNLCMVFNNNGSLTSINYADFWGQAGLTMSDGNPPDFDVLIFPIIQDGTGLNDEFTINELTLKSVSPNPANDFAQFNINLAEPASLTIDLVGLDGKIILSYSKENCPTGDHQFQFDVRTLPSGSYYYLINSGNTKFGGKLNIVR